MLGCVQMVQDNEKPIAKCTDLIPSLARVAPNLELIAVASSLVQVFLLIESQLCLPVVPTMIVVEEQVVVGGD